MTDKRQRNTREVPHASGRDFPVSEPDPEFPARELVRVVVRIDRQALEDLEVMVRHRHRGATRNEVIGHAIMWLRAKEAEWLLRIKAGEERAARLAEEEARRVAFDRAEWERVQEETSVADAVRWVSREVPTKDVG